VNILIPLRKNYRGGDINRDHRLSSLNTHMESRNKAINIAPKVDSNVSSGISPVGVEARKIHSRLRALVSFMMIVRQHRGSSRNTVDCVNQGQE
jgi:hypothetical protein